MWGCAHGLTRSTQLSCIDSQHIYRQNAGDVHAHADASPSFVPAARSPRHRKDHLAACAVAEDLLVQPLPRSRAIAPDARSATLSTRDRDAAVRQLGGGRPDPEAAVANERDSRCAHYRPTVLAIRVDRIFGKAPAPRQRESARRAGCHATHAALDARRTGQGSRR